MEFSKQLTMCDIIDAIQVLFSIFIEHVLPFTSDNFQRRRIKEQLTRTAINNTISKTILKHKLSKQYTHPINLFLSLIVSSLGNCSKVDDISAKNLQLFNELKIKQQYKKIIIKIFFYKIITISKF